MPQQLGNDQFRKDDRADARPGLRRALDELAEFANRFGHPDTPVVQVEVPAPQPGQFAPAQVAASREQHQCPVSRLPSPAPLRQRCLIHRARNILAKIPARIQAEVKEAYWKIFGTEGLTTGRGPDLVKIIDARIDAFADRYRGMYPAAVKILLTDREGLTAYLRFPAEHRHRIRHSNFIERTFGETSCLTLVWAVLDRASAGWRGFTMTSAGLRLLQDLRRSPLQPPRQLRPRTVTAAQPDDQPETVRATA